MHPSDGVKTMENITSWGFPSVLAGGVSIRRHLLPSRSKSNVVFSNVPVQENISLFGTGDIASLLLSGGGRRWFQAAEGS